MAGLSSGLWHKWDLCGHIAYHISPTACDDEKWLGIEKSFNSLYQKLLYPLQPKRKNLFLVTFDYTSFMYYNICIIYDLKLKKNILVQQIHLFYEIL